MSSARELWRRIVGLLIQQLPFNIIKAILSMFDFYKWHQAIFLIYRNTFCKSSAVRAMGGNSITTWGHQLSGQSYSSPEIHPALEKFTHLQLSADPEPSVLFALRLAVQYICIRLHYKLLLAVGYFCSKKKIYASRIFFKMKLQVVKYVLLLTAWWPLNQCFLFFFYSKYSLNANRVFAILISPHFMW